MDEPSGKAERMVQGYEGIESNLAVLQLCVLAAETAKRL